MPDTADLLQIRDLRFSWPGSSADVLQLAELYLAPGRSYFLHGPSGCGKSTLLGLMAGVLLPPRAGWNSRARTGRRCRPAAETAGGPTSWV